MASKRKNLSFQNSSCLPKFVEALGLQFREGRQQANCPILQQQPLSGSRWSRSSQSEINLHVCKCHRNLAFIKELTEKTISGAATTASIDMALTNATPRPRMHVGITSTVNWKPTMYAYNAKNPPSIFTIILSIPSEKCKNKCQTKHYQALFW